MLGSCFFSEYLKQNCGAEVAEVLVFGEDINEAWGKSFITAGDIYHPGYLSYDNMNYPPWN